MSRTIEQREHLRELADRIAASPKPLGATMEDGCWGAVAIQTAREHGESPLEYFGLSDPELQAAITENRETHAQIRNVVMLRRTLEMIS